MSFVVEVTHPYCASDRNDRRIECGSLVELASELDEFTGCGVLTAGEIAADVAHGEDFEEEVAEGRKVVTARRVTAVVA